MFSGAVVSAENNCNKDISTFLNCNNPIVMNYLSSLTDKDIGHKVAGIKLTDSKVLIKDYKFLGKSTKVHQSINLYLFEFNGRQQAVVWINSGGMELAIPKCPAKTSFADAFVLSGDVYTWKAVQPEHGVVQIFCIGNNYN